MSKSISRREFLKLGALSLGALAFNSFPPPQEENDYPSGEVGRVAYKSVSVFKEPVVGAETLAYRFLDELLNIYYEVTPETGPSYNPRWYRVWGGWVHSAQIQRVKFRLNQPMVSLPESGHQLCEVTVPYTTIYQFSQGNGWQRKNRLYYETTHWTVGIDEGPDGEAWYRLYDELLEMEYHVPAVHLRPVPDEEITPLSPGVPPHLKRIEVSLQWQTLKCFEEERLVFETKISSGIPSGKNPPEGTNTPAGRWNVYSKMATKHMGNGLLTGAPDVYTLPGVPWTMFFHKSGAAFHGAYWHDNFGVPMSHGCVNMRMADAKWLFRWTTPLWPPEDGRFWERTGNGTAVHVI
jgi:hypothetical protein